MTTDTDAEADAIVRLVDERGTADRLSSIDGSNVRPLPEPAAEGPDEGDRFPRLDWHKAFAEDFSHVEWVLGRFMERGQQVSLVGDGKSGKTLFVLEWLWRAVSGRSFLGDQSRAPLRVLYFDRENSLRDIITRMQAFGAAADDLAERFDYRMFPRFNGSLNDSPVAAAELLRIAEESQPDIVVLDTVSRFISGSENDSEPWLDLYRRIHMPLKSSGIAGYRLDHFGKDSDRGSRGSSAKSQDVDHVWELSRMDEQHEACPDDGSELVTTTLRLRRTHTRTGIGADEMVIARAGRKSASGLWLPGQTSHRLADADAVREHRQMIQTYVDELIVRGVPRGLGRARLAEWARAKDVTLPGKNDLLSQVVKELKQQQGD